MKAFRIKQVNSGWDGNMYVVFENGEVASAFEDEYEATQYALQRRRVLPNSTRITIKHVATSFILFEVTSEEDDGGGPSLQLKDGATLFEVSNGSSESDHD